MFSKLSDGLAYYLTPPKQEILDPPLSGKILCNIF